ncbi:hypothetical protein QBC39DRAFT_419790 [Podospora conica]|nr:hypothetical protein QBC39DRAFT_419790 [Schizothecium conicum]
MASPTKNTFPPSLDALEKENLVQVIKDWSIAHGLAVRPPPAVAANDPEGILAINAPVTLFPSPFPKACFDDAKAVQKAYNELYANISRDEKFLEELVHEVAAGDDFIANLWDVHLKVKEEGYVQNLTLGLFRSDYMVHHDNDGLQIKQVEFNTIASSFGGLSSQTSALHKHLAATEYPLLHASASLPPLHLPPNPSTASLAAGLAAAYTAYGAPTLSHPTCILFLVQPSERNIFDQRHLEYALHTATSGAPVFRLTLPSLPSHTTLGPSRQLLYHPPQNPSLTYECAVTYLRAGYGPSDYPTPVAWAARRTVERSATIACPSVLAQLSGMKKVQQVLASSTELLDRFLSNAADREAVRRTFTNIYPLDETPAGLAARELATDAEKCVGYVMKPQREGGGNNVYRGAIPRRLAELPEAHWGSYILMELIEPPAVGNVILRNGKLEEGGVICELGVYGTCLWDRSVGVGEGGVVYNEEAGYLLRTKGDQSEEGGVAAGYGCMDSVVLV